MQPIDRRKFLGIVGAGSAAAAAAAATPAVASLIASPGGGKLSFHAESGLPAKPWPAYATAIAEGSVDLERGTGLVATRVVAGYAANSSDIGLPGMTRVVRITRASVVGSEVRMHGVVEDRSQLMPGESARVRMVLDRNSRELRTSLGGNDVTLSMS